MTIFTCNAGLAVELKETEYHLPKAKGTLEKSSRKENKRKRDHLISLSLISCQILSHFYVLYISVYVNTTSHVLAHHQNFSAILCSVSTGQSKQFQELRAALQGCSGDTHDDGTVH